MKRRFWFVVPVVVVAMLVLIATHQPAPEASKVAWPSAPLGSPQMMQNKTEYVPHAASMSNGHKEIASLTLQRAAVYNATDVLAMARKVLVSGTPDEKGWAHDLIRECNAYTIGDVPKHYDKPGQREAWADLANRCAGLKSMTRPERNALLGQLAEGKALSVSPLHTVEVLYTRMAETGDNRWTNIESDVVSSALYADDPALQREAFHATLRAIDKLGPGGDARSEALLYAMGETYTSTALSDFERIQRCVMFEGCDPFANTPTAPSDGSPRPGEPTEAEKARLRKAYAEAFARHASASEILAIR